MIYATGCLKMLEEFSLVHPQTVTFATFTSLVRDKLYWMGMTGNFKMILLPKRCSSFTDRFTYYVQLCITGEPKGTWQEPIIEAMNDFLCDHLRMGMVWFHDIVKYKLTVPEHLAIYLSERMQNV
jgi:hypothetical protein